MVLVAVIADWLNSNPDIMPTREEFDGLIIDGSTKWRDLCSHLVREENETRVDADTYYMIDTLGERLYEGCNRVFVLMFDDSSLMQGKTEENKVVICRGKECCREFLTAFLAAIPVGELEMEETKATVPYFSLHQRLQIEFNFCTTIA